MILRLLLYIACILPYSAFCQTHGTGQSPLSPSTGRALPVQHNLTGNFTRLRTYTSARDGNMKGVAHGNFSQIRANIGHYRRR